MLTIFNRKELIVTLDFNCHANVRNILSENRISHAVKTINRLSRNKPAANTFYYSFEKTDTQKAVPFCALRETSGTNLNSTYEYKIYVHKNDFEKAKHLIGR